ncbi:hypothetical protein HB912_12335 [Listeria aquatica]|uniref:Uncharacterized protein n=1 Tax=Listeria aquatica TaxID=1494960 RepID=A0A841ZPM5_9LIST|nr:hypothetical protein [Listeria aquatica]MBC1522436.1 hypothetical protein [Listeria aquatica]
MDGFQAYVKLEELQELISDSKETKPPYQLGTTALNEQTGKVETRWTTISREQYLAEMLDVVSHEITNIQQVLYMNTEYELVQLFFTTIKANKQFQREETYRKEFYQFMHRLLEDKQLSELLLLEFLSSKEFFEIIETMKFDEHLEPDYMDPYAKYEDYLNRSVSRLAEKIGISDFIENQLNDFRKSTSDEEGLQ